MPSAKTEEGPKKFRTPEECKVCAVPCFYNYYRVRCCEGCKQFFRRAIRNLRDYRCQRRRPGHCNIEKGDRCLGCRLDKCLLVGMNAGQIKQQPANDRRTEDFLQKMAERRHHFLQTRGMNNLELMEADWERAEEEDREPECGGQQEEQVQVEKVGHFKREEEAEEDYSQGSSSSSSDCLSEPLPLVLVAVNDVVPLSVAELKLQWDDDFRTLDSLMRTEQKQRRVWEALTDVPPGWLETFDSLEQMVQSPVNILLDLADQFGISYKSAFKNPKPETDRDRINVTVGFIKVDRTLLVDVAKALPFFQQLEFGDKIILLKKAAIPGATLCNSFYSAALGEQTWTRTSGIQFIKHFKCSPLAGDKKLSQMNQLFLCDSVAIIRQVNPSQEEFVLLLALLYCNSNAADLSPAGRELLYSQSLNYTRMLMSLCQRRLGQMEGAKRLAECFFLLDAMGRMGNVFEMIKSYQEMLYSQRVVRPLFPRSLAAITPRVYS